MPMLKYLVLVLSHKENLNLLNKSQDKGDKKVEKIKESQKDKKKLS